MKKNTFTLCFKFLILILLCGQNLFSQWSSNWKWSSGSPWGDESRFIKMISETEYIGFGFYGGMIRTTDGGNTWTIRGDVSGYTGTDAPHLRDGWFFDSNNGYAVGDQSFLNGIITRTSNGGLNWSTTTLPSTSINSIFFLNSNTGFAVGAYLSSGFKTTNGGLNWTTMTMGGTDQFQDVFALDANNIYAVGGKNLYKSTDGGVTWTNSQTSISYASHFSVYFKDVNTGFIGGDAGGFQVTTDGGITWATRNVPATENLIKGFKFNDPEILAVGDTVNLFKTTDYGLTWTSLNFKSSAPANISGSMSAIDKINNTIVISGTLGLIYKSTDNGNTWSSLTVSLHKGYLQGLYAFSMSGKVWAVGEAAPYSVLYSSNGGNTWSNNFGGARTENLRDVNFLNENTGYMCGEGGAVLRTSNGGLNWTSFPPLTIQAANCISIIDNNNVIIGCNNGKILVSTDAGLSFSLKNLNASNTSPINQFSFIDANTGWAVSGSKIYKSTDKGASWNLQYSHTTTLLSIDMCDLNTGYACGYSGSLFKTTNGGVNWIQKPSQIPYNLTKIDFVNINSGFAVSGGGFTAPGCAMKTTNGGTTWQIVNPGGSQLFNIKVFHPDSAISVGLGGIYKYSAPSNFAFMGLTLNFESCPVKDTVSVELRSNTSPYNIIDSKKGLAGQGTQSVFTFTAASNGIPYYISVKHRNAVTTWNSGAVSFAGNVLIYNFASSASQAYGNNMINSGGMWSFYQGDINQDEIIDAADVSSIENDVSITKTGSYLNTDLNCDEIVDASDLSVADNNSGILVQVIKP